jgi:mitochondrial fission protein ELM1
MDLELRDLAGEVRACVVSEPYAGLQAQALGLAEAAGLAPGIVELHPRRPWSWLPAARWPAPLRAVGLSESPGDLLITAGGTAGAVGAALRRQGARVVQVQNPRMALDRFDLVVANAHDGISGPNVIVTRTALHRATVARLREAAAIWRPRFAHLPRPLVAVLVGGSNGRFRLEKAEGAMLAAELAKMMVTDQPGVAITPSRRTAPAVRDVLARTLTPLGAWVWDMAGENPYFGLLACADAIVVTVDSISMVSEAAATRAPVFYAELPGRSKRISRFMEGLLREERVRPFAGRLLTWPVQPIDDTPMAGAEVARRLGLSHVE